MRVYLSVLKRKICLGRTGLTAVELVVILAILAVTLGLAIPTFSNWSPSYQLRGAARDLFSAFQLAKTFAVNKGINCTICFRQPMGSIIWDYVVFVDSDKDLEYDPGEKILDIGLWGGKNFPGVSFDHMKGGGDGLTFLSNDNGVPTVSFNPHGIPLNNNGGMGMGTAFLVNSKGQKARVVLSSAGNITIK